MKTFFLVLLYSILTEFGLSAQSLSGNWDIAGSWTPSGIPANNPNTNISLTGNGTLNGGNVHTIGNISAGGLSLSIGGVTAGHLTIGSSALFSVPTKKSLTYTAAGGALTIGNNGILEIWGDLILGNGFTLTLTGNAQLIIHGNLTDNGTGGATITINGTSSITVGGNLSLGAGGQINKTGGASIKAHTCSCTGCGGQCGVVPVTLLFFEAHAQPNKVELNWSTASELNFDYFSVERSVDGSAFYEIDQTKGHGTSKERNDYSFNDEFPIMGKSYYRLTSVDFDEYKETFKVVAVNYSGARLVRIFPNPVADGNLNIELTFTPAEDVKVNILDLNGVAVGSFKIHEQNSSFQLDLNPGTYLVKITSSDFNKVIRLAVR